MTAIERMFVDLERAPDDAALAVLADALQERGDVRGELGNVQQALARAPKGERAKLHAREKALIHATRIRLLGALAPLPGLEIEFRLGFAERMALACLSKQQLVTALGTAFRSQDARLLRTLEITSDEDDSTEITQVMTALAKEAITPPPALRRLRLGDAFERDPDDRVWEDGEEALPSEDLSGVLEAFPNLVDLQVDLGVVSVQWEPLVSPCLERFTWIAPRILEGELEPLADSRLPALTSFTLWTGGTYEDAALDADDDDDGDDDDDDDDREDESGGRFVRIGALSARALRPILRMLDRHPSLRELALPHYRGSITALVGELAKHELIRRIETFDLSHTSLSGSDADELADLLRTVPSIKQLRIEQGTASESVRKSLSRSLGPRLVAHWAEAATRFRFVSAGE